MNLKQIIILLAILALCIGGVLMVNSSRSSAVKAPPSVLGEQPFKGLPVNDVTAFSIKSGDGEVTVKKVDDQWAVENRGGYPADFSKVSKLIRELAEIKVAEEVPAGASALERLELIEPSGDAEQKGVGTVVKVSGSEGSELAGFTLGKEYEGGMTSGPFGSFANSTGRFMKKGDSIVIISGTLTEAKASAADWLDKEFFKVQKVARLEYTAEEEGDSWALERSEDTGDYYLLAPKEGEVVDKAKSGPLKNAFSSPSFKDVVVDASDETTGLDGGRAFKIETFEGFQYEIKIGKTTEDGDYYLTVEVEADFPTEYVAEEAEGGTEATEDGDAGDAEKKEQEAKRKQDEFKAEVERKQEKLDKEKALAGTVFVVNKWSVESLLKKRSELLEEPEEPEGATEDSDAGADTSPLKPSPSPSAGTAPSGEGRPRITAVTPPIEVPVPSAGHSEEKAEESEVKSEAETEGDQVSPSEEGDGNSGDSPEPAPDVEE